METMPITMLNGLGCPECNGQCNAGMRPTSELGFITDDITDIAKKAGAVIVIGVFGFIAYKIIAS